VCCAGQQCTPTPDRISILVFFADNFRYNRRALP
jgi:hypothetical protein